ncbi:MAG: hypothetical protein WCF98_12800 [Synechococcus sp. ELA057]
MKLSKSIIHSAVISASIVAASLPARAAIVTYTDRAAFLAALSSSSPDDYNDLNGFYASPLSRTITGYTYDAAATGGLYIDNVNGSKALSTNSSVPLTLAFTAGAPTAVGGYFYNTDFSLNVFNRVITVTANPGASAQSVVTGSATNFFGWLDDSGTPFTSLVIEPGVGIPVTYATVDDLVLGQAAPASVPGPLPLIGAATAFGFSRRLRSRIAAARPRA